MKYSYIYKHKFINLCSLQNINFLTDRIVKKNHYTYKFINLY